MNNLEFILKLNDMLTPGMRQAAQVSDSTANKVVHDFDRIEKKSEITGISIKNMFGAIGIGFGFYKLGEMLDKGIEKAHAFHEAEAALANTMRNMGNYSEAGFEKIIKGAGEMASKIKFGKTDIIDLQSQLRMVGNIGESEMIRMTKASADMATKFKMGLNEAGNSLAKAVNNPEMLRRLGMQLKIDPAIQLHLQNLAKNGHEAAARLQLLSIVEQKVGGAAEAAFNADPLARYNKAIGAMQMKLGESAIRIQTLVAPAIEWLANKFKDLVDYIPRAIKWLIDNKDALIGLTIAVGGTVIAINAYTWATKTAAFFTTIWEGAQAALNFVMNMNPIVRIISLIFILIGIIYTVAKQYDGWGKSMLGLWEVIKGFVNFNKAAWKDLGENIWYWIQYAWLKTKGFIEWAAMAFINLNKALALAATFKFAEAKAVLTAEIKTTASTQLEELEKRHAAGILKNQADGIAAVKQMQDGWAKVGLKKKSSAVDATTENQSDKLAGGGTGSGTDLDTGKAGKINQGGQREVKIYITKQIGAENIYVTSGKEAADEIANHAREGMRRALMSLNGNVTSE